MKLFNDYARGGLEYLYNKLVTRSTSPDDEFVDAKIASAYLAYLPLKTKSSHLK